MQYDHLFVKFFGWYEDKAHVFIAMEYLELGDLGTYMVDEQQTAKENAQEITQQILEGLEALHKEGICHRDLKPQVRTLLVVIPPTLVLLISNMTRRRIFSSPQKTQYGPKLPTLVYQRERKILF